MNSVGSVARKVSAQILFALVFTLCWAFSAQQTLALAGGHTSGSSSKKKHGKKHRPHPQSLHGPLKGSGLKIVKVKRPGGRGGVGDPGDDYPAKYKNPAQDTVLDQWKELNRECTSFVAWALWSRNHFTMPFYDDADNWGPKARRLGYAVNGTPALGSVAWSASGHVAYVVGVSGGRVTIEEYNHVHGAYSKRSLPAGYFTDYIHFKDRPEENDPSGEDSLGRSPAVASGSNGLPVVAAIGENSSLHMFWETPDAQWHGPLGVGASAQSAPAISVGSNGLPNVSVQGPSNSLWTYWETPDAQWHGPLGIGANIQSAPASATGSSGLPVIAVRGPSDSLWVYWETSDAQWHGPLGVGAGVQSAPAIATGASGLPVIAVQGPNDSLHVYWETPDAQWHGPLGVGDAGSTLSTPSIVVGSNGLPTIAVQGPSNSVWIYWESTDAQWHGPLGVAGEVSSAPAMAKGSSGLPVMAVQGPSHSLYAYWQTPDAQWHGPLGVGGADTTFARPAITTGTAGLPTVITQGPSGSLYDFWETPDAQWHGPLGIAGPLP